MPDPTIDVQFKKILFRIIEYLRKEPILSCLEELEQNQNKGKLGLLEIQRIKLFKLLTHLRTNVPYYRSRFGNELLIGNQDEVFDALNKLPIITKHTLREHLDEMITPDDIKVYPVKTSGSTGNPLKFFKDRIASAYAYAAMYRSLGWYGISYCDREALLWGIPIGKLDYLSSKCRDFILNRFRESKFELSDKVNQDFYQAIVRRTPLLLSGYSTLIYEFAKYLKINKLDNKCNSLRLIKYTAEMMFDYQREFIEEVFSCPVISEYGSAETGVVSYQCPKGSHHILTDCVYVEFEKDCYTDFYKIIVTNLNSFGVPIIRYDTGDLIRSNVFKQCSCNLPFPVIGEIVGRSSDIVLTPEGRRIHSNIFSYIIKEIIKTHANIDQLKFIQRTKDEIIVEMKNAAMNDQLKEDITRLIKQRISPDIAICFNVVKDFTRTDSGKLRYFVSEVQNVRP